MRAALGYERSKAEFTPKVKLVISFDFNNQVGRMCRPANLVRREWRVTTPLQDQWLNQYYLVTHIDNPKITRIIRERDMHDLW